MTSPSSAAPAFPPPALASIASEVAELLKSRSETLAIAETAAGGLISAAILATPGASRVYKGGLTLYTLESRVAFVGWTQADIEAYRGPTTAVVEGLARSARTTLGATYCVGESGMAGPTGIGSAPNRQPGYVALAVVSENGVLSKDLNTGLGNDRNANMVAFATEALTLVKEFIENGDSGSSNREGKM